jgi:hypothetical protein
MYYRKKPLVIQAVQFDGTGGMPEVELHMIDSDTDWICQTCGNPSSMHGNVKTLEGYHIACPGDWIITGISGEHYPCKPDIFEKTYEAVESESCDCGEGALQTIDLDFGQALRYLKAGKKVARVGWNGKGQFLYIIKGTELQSGLKYGFGESQGEPQFVDVLCMKSAQNTLVVGWLASQTDMLANDWQVVE